MTRELKFRVWDIQLKKFNYFDIHSAWGNIPSDSRQNIQQFSGHKDKYGKEIYEGDIIIFMGKWDEQGNVLEPDYEPYKVVWGFHAMKMSRNKWSSILKRGDVMEVGHTNSEIIGNVFE